MIASKEPSALIWAGEVLGRGDAREIADDDRFGLGQGLLGVGSPRFVARMQDDPVALIGKKPANHEAEAV